MTLHLAYYTHHLSPFLFQWGNGWGIRYYGLAYALGFLFFYYGLRTHQRRGLLPLTQDQLDETLFSIAVVGVLIGGRLGYCLFYDFAHTVHDPLSVIKVWEGGMASHGGILGVIGVMLFLAHRYRIAFYSLADAAAWSVPIGLGLGRLANFINGELWGRPSTVPWAVIFPEAGDGIPRHPSQLYEALLEGLLLFVLLNIVRSRCDPNKPGAVALTFVGAYGVLRIIGEFFREPDAPIGYYFGWLTQGQLFSAGMILFAGGLALLRARSYHTPSVRK